MGHRALRILAAVGLPAFATVVAATFPSIERFAVSAPAAEPVRVAQPLPPTLSEPPPVLTAEELRFAPPERRPVGALLLGEPGRQGATPESAAQGALPRIWLPAPAGTLASRAEALAQLDAYLRDPERRRERERASLALLQQDPTTRIVSRPRPAPTSPSQPAIGGGQIVIVGREASTAAETAPSYFSSAPTASSPSGGRGGGRCARPGATIHVRLRF